MMRELITDERSVVAAQSAVVAGMLLALVILGAWEIAANTAEIHERAATRGFIRADLGALRPVMA